MQASVVEQALGCTQSNIPNIKLLNETGKDKWRDYFMSSHNFRILFTAVP